MKYKIPTKKYKRHKVQNSPSDMLLLVVVCGKRQEVGQRPGSSSVQCLLDASFGHDHNGYKYNTNMDHRHHWMMTIIPDDKRNVARTIWWHKFGFFFKIALFRLKVKMARRSFYAKRMKL